MDKRGQGISMNVIIIAAIALLVLVVLSVVFMGRMGTFSSGTAECNNQGGKCSDVACGTPGSDVATLSTPFDGAKCPSGQTCCIVGG